jgi:hypothetical protein
MWLQVQETTLKSRKIAKSDLLAKQQAGGASMSPEFKPQCHQKILPG